MKQISLLELEEIYVNYTGVDFFRETVQPFIARVQNRGDTVLLYTNHDLGHPGVGEPRVVSYGSVACFLERQLFSEPPQSLPDTPHQINWRFCLEGALVDVEPERVTGGH